MEQKTALITGAAGFIGSHVADHLIKNGYKVVALDDLSGGFRSNLNPEALFVRGSITDVKLVDSLFKKHKFEYVFHLAAYAAEGLSHFIRRYNYENNLLGSVNLINAAVNYKTKCFVFTSSIAVYGKNQVPMKESLVPSPEDPYGISKFAVELDLKAAHELFGLNYLIFRPHNVYGERQNIADRYRNVVGIFMNNILQGKPLPIFGDGLQERAFTHIDDVAPLIAKSIEYTDAYNKVFNIGSDESCTVKKLAYLISENFNVAPKIEYQEARNEVKIAYADHGLIKDFFDYEPKVSLERGIQKMSEWVKDFGARSGQEFKNIEISRNLPPSWQKNGPRVCFFGIYDQNYPRNKILLQGLRENGVEIVELNASALDTWRYFKLIKKLFKNRHRFDVIYAAFPSPTAALVAKIFSRKPVVADIFFSMYDAVVNDRKEASRFHPRALKLLLVDWLAMLFSDFLIADSQSHADYYSSWFGIIKKKVGVVYIGVNPDIKKEPHHKESDSILVQFHGNYVPLQGIEKIIQAFEEIKNEPGVRFRIVGGNEEKIKKYSILEKLGNRAEIITKIPFDQMNHILNEADIVLGIFGDSMKASRVIPNKVFEGLAAGKPVISMDSPAMREVFNDTDLLLVKNTPQDLAAGLKILLADEKLRQKLAQDGHRKVMSGFTTKVVGKKLKDYLTEIAWT